MKCPNCQRENELTNRFCIFCGALLPTSESQNTVESGQGSGEIPSEQLQILQNEVSRLSELMVLMNERLAALERRQGITAPEPTPVTAPEPVKTPVTAAVTSQETVGVTADRIPPRQAKPIREKEREWEQILGGSWLARIGVLAVVIGIGFFLKFAFDNNWIGPTGRVILGIVAGLAMLGLGYFWRKKYPVLTQVLSGGGIAVLYLAIFASFAIYDLVNIYAAVAFLFLVSVASAALALRYNSMALAIIGIFGAFVAPFILGGFGARGPVAQEAGRAFQLILYLIIVDIGVLILSTFRNWRWFTLLALFCSLVAFGVWWGEFEDNVSLAMAEGGLTIIFVVFVGATSLFHIIWRRVPQVFDYALMVINAAAYFSISLALMWGDLRVWLGGFSLLVALFYGGLAYIVMKRGIENLRLSFFALGLALVFLTVAIPVQLGDKAWTTIAWAVEGTILIWLSFTLRLPQLRGYGYVIFFIMGIRLLVFDTTLDMRTFQAVLNERFLAFVVSIAALYLSGYLLWRKREALSDVEKGAWSLYPVIFVAANFFALWLLSAEAINTFDTPLALTAVWAVYAVILLVIGMWKQWRLVRLAALALLVIPIGKVFVYDVFVLKTLYRIIAFVGLGVLLLVSAYLYQRYSKSIRGFIAKK